MRGSLGRGGPGGRKGRSFPFLARRAWTVGPIGALLLLLLLLLYSLLVAGPTAAAEEGVSELLQVTWRSASDRGGPVSEGSRGTRQD